MRTVRAGCWIVTALLVGACGSDGDDDGADAADAADVAEVADADAVEALDEVSTDDGGPPETADGAGSETAEDGGGEAAEVGRDETPAANAPICEGGTGSGTRRRWVDPVSGYEYCEAPCRGCTAECRAAGTPDEGWYAVCDDPTTEAGCGDAPGLIGRVDCG